MDIDDEKYKRAKARVQRMRDFYSSVITFVWVNILLLIINFITSPRNLWFYWVTIIWGFVLIIKAINLFSIRDHLLGEEWEKRKIDEIVNKDKRDENKKP
jgi:hypothetical protein